MKKILLMTLVSVVCVQALCQGQTFQKGTSVVSLGVGLGSSLGSFTASSSMPAFSVQYERGVWNIGEVGVVSLGGYLGTKSFKYANHGSGYGFTEKWNYTIIGLRSAFHYTGLASDHIDVYGGAMLSYNKLSYHYKSDNGSGEDSDGGSYGSTAGLTLYVGGRYFFAPSIAAFAELGYGVSYLTLGLAFKF